MFDADGQYSVLYEGNGVVEQLRTYVIGITAAGLIAGILLGIVRSKDTSGTLLRVVVGMFLTFTVIRPIVNLNIGDINSNLTSFSQEAGESAADGEILARDFYCSYIKSETQAYILDKAEDYGADLTVEICLDDSESAVPVGVQIRGSVSPYAKTALGRIMERDLGILKENQVWID
ncbi:MAG: hypothetical protein J6C98_04925 [Oscillospiraceae bacterium]|nr:hypothetical protein [Oscillospiraceae bacterium]